MPAPRHWFALFRVGFELEQRIVYAVEEDLVVDMFALGDKRG